MNKLIALACGATMLAAPALAQEEEMVEVVADPTAVTCIQVAEAYTVNATAGDELLGMIVGTFAGQRNLDFTPEGLAEVVATIREHCVRNPDAVVWQVLDRSPVGR